MTSVVNTNTGSNPDLTTTAGEVYYPLKKVDCTDPLRKGGIVGVSPTRSKTRMRIRLQFVREQTIWLGGGIGKRPGPKPKKSSSSMMVENWVSLQGYTYMNTGSSPVLTTRSVTYNGQFIPER